MKIVFAAIVATLMFVSCSNEILNGDQGEIKGQATTLSLTMKNRIYKTKAVENDGTIVSGDDLVYNFVVYVFNSDSSLNVSPKYFEVTGNTPNTPTPAQTVNILINPGTGMSVYVVANVGNPAASNNILNNVSSQGDLISQVWDFSATPMIGGETDTPIVQTGNDMITGNATTGYSADVELQIVPMCISLESISLFGIQTQSLTGNPNGDEAAINAYNAGISSITIDSINILNAVKTSWLFPHDYDSDPGVYYTNNKTMLNGFTSSFGSGTFYPGSTFTSIESSSLTQDLAGHVPLRPGIRPFFCVAENKYNTVGESSPVTLVVITCTVVTATTGPNGESRYFTIPLNQILTDNLIPDYSAKHGSHIKLTVDIASEGQVNPYTPMAKLSLTVKPNTFKDVFASINFPNTVIP